MKIDLHTHTHHSDGLLSPAELVMRAATMQVDVLAITDHDTVAGVNEAQQAVEDAKVSMKIVPGIELSTRWRGFDIHILGLNLDHQCPQLLQRLTIQHQYRMQRAEQIDAKLQKAGIHGVLTRAQELAGVGQVTRAHFARAMVEMQVVNDMQAAFKRYLGKGQRAFVTPQWITVEEAIHWIREAGGKAVLAHPTHYDLSAKWIRRLTAEFCQHGGEGIEVTHPQMTDDKKQFLYALAHEHDLQASAGSDFHSPGRWTELGRRLSFDDALQPVWHDWSLTTSERVS